MDTTRTASPSPPHALASGCARLLLVEVSERLRCALEPALARRAIEVRSAASVAQAGALLQAWHPDAMVLDCELPDGDGFDVLREIRETDPAPAVVAISGTMQPGKSFRLAQMGVRAFVPKPIAHEALERALDQALDTAPDLVPLVRAAVGHIGMHELTKQVRHTMLSEALARTRGCRNAAARLLAVSRQLVQHMLRKDDC